MYEVNSINPMKGFNFFIQAIEEFIFQKGIFNFLYFLRTYLSYGFLKILIYRYLADF